MQRRRRERFWPLDETRFVLLTSGTTAVPQPIRLKTSQLVLSAFGSAMRLGHGIDDVWLLALPLHHVGGLQLLMRALWGVTTVRVHEPFAPAVLAQALDAGAISLVSLVPSMLGAGTAGQSPPPLSNTAAGYLGGRGGMSAKSARPMPCYCRTGGIVMGHDRDRLAGGDDVSRRLATSGRLWPASGICPSFGAQPGAGRWRGR